MMWNRAWPAITVLVVSFQGRFSLSGVASLEKARTTSTAFLNSGVSNTATSGSAEYMRL